MEKDGKEKFNHSIMLFFSQKETKIFIFVLSTLVIIWPFISSFSNKNPRFYFIYYFAFWSILVIYLMLSCAKNNVENKKDD